MGRIAMTTHRDLAPRGTRLALALIALSAATTATPAFAYEHHAESGGFAAWLTGTDRPAGEVSDLTVDVRPSSGRRVTALRVPGPLVLGNPGQPDTALRLIDVDSTQTENTTPEALVTYSAEDVSGDDPRRSTYVWVLSSSTNAALGTQCSGGARSRAYVGPVEVAHVSGQSGTAVLVGAVRTLPDVFTEGEDLGPIVASSLRDGHVHSTLTTPEVVTRPDIVALVEQNSQRLTEAYERALAEGAPPAIRQARFVSWYADQVLLGRTADADATFGREAERMAADDLTRARLRALRSTWGDSPDAALASLKHEEARSRRQRKAQTIQARYAFEATIARVAGRIAVSVQVRRRELVGQPATITILTRPGGRGRYRRLRQTITLAGNAVIFTGPSVGRLARTSATVSVSGFRAGLVTVRSGTRQARRQTGAPPAVNPDPLA